ncbi:MAG TPA: SpoIID/LytB domain-containing protein [Actinomycetota bacterium]|jgi:SpoIID/LytB domain protein|nr:SpoIID/LytB domain-containing protein [Actinomycetota bacterium]
MRRRIALVLSLCAGLVLLPGTAGAGTTFTFYGSGWGHGIGLSQWGAQGLATKGWGPAQIVRHYYRGTSVAQRTPPARRFRIGLIQYDGEVTLRAESGSFRLELSSGRVLSRVREDGVRKIQIRRLADGRDVYRIRSATGKLLASGGSPTNHLLALRNAGAVVRVVDSHWPHMVGRGSLQFNIVGRASAHLLAIVPPEEYLFGLAEVPSSWDADALQAQAIAARSYAWEKIARLGQKRSGCNCGLFATTVDQYYVGWDKEVATMGDRWVAAVQGSSRRVAQHDGATIQAYYSSASGGHTENNEVVWGGTAKSYLRGVCDPAEYDVTSASESTLVLERWSAAFGDSALSSRLGLGIGTVRDFRNFVLGVSGRVKTVTVVGSNGSAVVTGWTIRGRLGLRDTRFWVNSNHNITGRLRRAYDNLSCKPGIAAGSQRSINGGRFQAFANGRLYLHSAKDVVTWIRGAILTKYVAKGAHRGVLDLPYRWRTIDDGRGRRAWFDNGQILWKTSRAEAFEIHGPVLAHYLATGSFSLYGYPISDVQAPDALTRQSDFQNGTELRSIVCTRPDTASAWSCS